MLHPLSCCRHAKKRSGSSCYPSPRCDHAKRHRRSSFHRSANCACYSTIHHPCSHSSSNHHPSTMHPSTVSMTIARTDSRNCPCHCQTMWTMKTSPTGSWGPSHWHPVTQHPSQLPWPQLLEHLLLTSSAALGPSEQTCIVPRKDTPQPCRCSCTSLSCKGAGRAAPLAGVLMPVAQPEGLAKPVPQGAIAPARPWVELVQDVLQEAGVAVWHMTRVVSHQMVASAPSTAA
mmetsp:Transcript_60029/g.142956  ORF Transcript_60029/g.142956 Transcript_60029/m.142956 type:complete len:231 (-) Transcript_60029:545-1237(-)